MTLSAANRANFVNLFSQAAGRNVYRYDTTDAASVVDDVGYFNTLNDALNLVAGDHINIFVWATAVRTGTVSAFINFVVTGIAANGDVTVTNDLLFTGGGGGASASQVITAAIGDSITAHGSQFVSPNTRHDALGIQTQHASLTNERFVLPPGNNKAVSGRTASQVAVAVATDLAAVADGTWTYCWMMMGVNSITAGSTAASVQGSIQTCIDYVCDTLGKNVLLQTILPADDVALDSGEETVREAVNVYIRAQDGAKSGKIIVIDFEPTFNNGSNNPPANATSDGKHPVAYGAVLLGQRARTILNGKGFADFALPSNFTTSNILLNGAMAGTAGPLQGSGVTGVSADSWRLRALNGTNAGRTGSKDAGGWMVMTHAITSASGPSLRLQQDVLDSAGGFAAGDTLVLDAIIQVDPGPVGFSSMSLNLSIAGTSITGFSIAVNGFSAPADGLIDRGGYYLMRTPILLLTGTGLTASAWLEVGKASADASSNFTVRVKAMRMFKYTPGMFNT